MSSMKISELFSVADKVVVVTGGGRGIGKMIAQGFVENGAKVYISSRKLDDLTKTADEFKLLGFCEYVQADLTETEGRQALIDTIAESEGGLDVLVNNAGFGWVEPVEEFSEAGYDKVMDINVKAPFFLTQGFLPLLEKRGTPERRSSVINVGSSEAFKITPPAEFQLRSEQGGDPLPDAEVRVPPLRPERALQHDRTRCVRVQNAAHAGHRGGPKPDGRARTPQADRCAERHGGDRALFRFGSLRECDRSGYRRRRGVGSDLIPAAGSQSKAATISSSKRW